LQGDLGLALAHPLYIMIGMAAKQIPVGDLAHRVNLISAVFGAVAIANVYLLMMLWMGNRFTSIITAVTLAVSWTFWQHCTIAEVYTLYAAILTAELIALLRYTQTSKVGWLYLLAFLNGLSIADHMWGILPLTCYVVFVGMLLRQRSIGFRSILVMATLWVIGAAPYEYLIINEMIRTGDVGGTLASALFGNMWKGDVLNTSLTLRMVLENIAFVVLNFPTPNIVFFFIGALSIRRLPSRRFGVIILSMMAMFFAFAFRYTVADRHAFFVPFYILAALCIGAGVHLFIARHTTSLMRAALLALAVIPVGVYCLTPTIGRHFYKSLADRRQVPYRDDYKYWLQPWQTGYTGGERFATEALTKVDKNAVIYADSTTALTLIYIHETRKMRPDVKVMSDFIAEPGAPALTEQAITEYMDRYPFYVVSARVGYCPQFLSEKYNMAKEGVLYHVLNRKGS
jgi:hypothetical protein